MTCYAEVRGSPKDFSHSGAITNQCVSGGGLGGGGFVGAGGGVIGGGIATIVETYAMNSNEIH